MCEEFIASIKNLTSSEDRQRARAWLAEIPYGMMVSVRGKYDENVHTLSLLNIYTLSKSEYDRGRGEMMAFVPISLYRELNQIGTLA